MARLVRSHPTLSGVIGILALGIAAVWLSSAGTPRAAATPTAAAAAALLAPPPLDPVIAGEIDALRRDTGLTNDAFNVLNLETPVDLLGDLKDWYTNNRDELASRRQALADGRGQIRRLRSAINNGQDQSAALASARTELAQLEVGFETFLDGMRTAVLGGLTSDQRETITRMKAQGNLPMPYRALPLTEEQGSALRKALLHQEQRRSTARTDERRAEVLRLFQQERDQALGAANLQLLATIQGYLGESSQRVVAAINEVLPTETGE